MTEFFAGRAARQSGALGEIRRLAALILLSIVVVYALPARQALAQSYSFNSIVVQGNQRIETSTVLNYAGIVRGQEVTAAQLNDAYQRVLGSGLFEEVTVTPQGSSLRINVREYPTISQISIEGNRRLKDENLLQLLQSQPRRVFSPAIAEADAAALTDAYTQAGRFAATVTPKIIRRSDNRVDLVFEIAEGEVVEVNRISFVGNRVFSDRRLRRILVSKQAGLFRRLIQSDTFIADRIEFDKQVLRDFYASRGYVDFEILSVTSEVSRERDGFFITFNIREGQAFKFGKISASSDLAEIDSDSYAQEIKVRQGKTYSPAKVDNSIARLETLAIRQGLNFIRVNPRVTRNDRDLTLDVDFEIVKGPRIFVERIDIEGNTTTLDRVIRRQFLTVEGDPFNPREIREAGARIRALGFFSSATVTTSEGSSPSQTILDVDVVEQPTGSVSFGGSYGVDQGFGLAIGFSERNFLGRGQEIDASINSTGETGSANFRWSEPAVLGRNLGFALSLFYNGEENNNSFYSTRRVGFAPSLEFPTSENGRIEVRYTASEDTVFNVHDDSSQIVKNEEGVETRSALGYTYSYDTRRNGLNPNAGMLVRFSQDVSGLGGTNKYLSSRAMVGAETKVYNEEVTLRAVVEGGGIKAFSGGTRVTDRFFLNGSTMRGFEANGLGPRDLNAVNRDGLGGNLFAVLRLDAEFPLGLPEEYGIGGGVFLDVGSVWSLNDTAGGPQGGVCPVADCTVDDTLKWRSSIGFSILWTTPIGPLRFNFSKALLKEAYDKERNFDLTISTKF